MNIVLATEVIHPGGAETFVLRLASALQSAGHRVHLFIFYKQGFREALVKKMAPDVPLRFADIPAEWPLQKADGLFAKLGVDSGLRKTKIIQSLQNLIKETGAEVVHSHLMKSDEVCLAATKDLNIPVVTTIHGDYLQFFDKTKRGLPVTILDYNKKATANLKELKKIVCISDKQLKFFQKEFATETAGKLEKIYNGYESNAVPKTCKREGLNIPENAFVFGMVSRGIADKGWERAIQAFKQLDNSGAHLILVGGGEHLEELQRKYGSEPRVHFAGHSDEPLEWIQGFDAGILPTTYPSESLPTVVIEYLYCGKPVIASEAGEIRNMIHQQGKEAGIILPLGTEKMTAALTEAMQSYLNNKNIYEQHKQNALPLFEAFRMDTCIRRYEAVYEASIVSKKTAV